MVGFVQIHLDSRDAFLQGLPPGNRLTLKRSGKTSPCPPGCWASLRSMRRREHMIEVWLSDASTLRYA